MILVPLKLIPLGEWGFCEFADCFLENPGPTNTFRLSSRDIIGVYFEGEASFGKVSKLCSYSFRLLFIDFFLL
jgi:hypothetical protein